MVACENKIIEEDVVEKKGKLERIGESERNEMLLCCAKEEVVAGGEYSLLRDSYICLLIQKLALVHLCKYISSTAERTNITVYLLPT